jgi:hypothetical protein
MQAMELHTWNALFDKWDQADCLSLESQKTMATTSNCRLWSIFEYADALYDDVDTPKSLKQVP